jgi:hypothetical protein
MSLEGERISLEPIASDAETGSIEFVSDTDPVTALSRVAEIATPVLLGCGYELEGRGRDWAHWTAGSRNVIRAYAFRGDEVSGVSMHRQGDVPSGVVEEVARAVVAATGWQRR